WPWGRVSCRRYEDRERCCAEAALLRDVGNLAILERGRPKPLGKLARVPILPWVQTTVRRGFSCVVRSDSEGYQSPSSKEAGRHLSSTFGEQSQAQPGRASSRRLPADDPQRQPDPSAFR